MAIVVESTTTNTVTGASSVTITKPTGLTEGDLMVAVLSMYSNTSTDVINTASGWTLAHLQSRAGGEVGVQYKYATADDVSASNFTFTATDVTVIFGGAILRVSGAAGSSPVFFADGAEDLINDVSTFSLPISFTPTFDGCLFVMGFTLFGDAGTGSVSNYNVTGSSLSWTELYDQTIDSGSDDEIIAGAYATQSTASAITAFGATISLSKGDKVGTIVAFLPRVDATASNALLQTSPVTFTTLTGSTQTVNSDFREISPEFNSQSGRANNQTPWTNETKPTTTWTNTPK